MTWRTGLFVLGLADAPSDLIRAKRLLIGPNLSRVCCLSGGCSSLTVFTLPESEISDYTKLFTVHWRARSLLGFLSSMFSPASFCLPNSLFPVSCSLFPCPFSPTVYCKRKAALTRVWTARTTTNWRVVRPNRWWFIQVKWFHAQGKKRRCDEKVQLLWEVKPAGTDGVGFRETDYTGSSFRCKLKMYSKDNVYIFVIVGRSN